MSPKPKRETADRYTEGEDIQMISFWVEYVSKPHEKKPLGTIWKEFKEWSKSTRSAFSLWGRFRLSIPPILMAMRNISLRTKVKILFEAKCRISEDILLKLRRSAAITVDDKGVIQKYEERAPGGLKLPVSSQRIRKSGVKKVKKERKIRVNREPPVEDSDENPDDVVFVENQNSMIPRPIPLVPMKEELVNCHHMVYPGYLSDSYSTWTSGTSEVVGTTSSSGMEMMTSLKEVLDAHLVAWKEIASNSARPAPLSPPPSLTSSESTSSTVSQNFSVFQDQNLSAKPSKKVFLHQLRNMIIGINRPEFEALKERISTEILEIGDENEDFPTELVNSSLNNLLDTLKSFGSFSFGDIGKIE